MFKVITITVAMFLGACTPNLMANTYKVTNKRTLEIIGGIDGRIIEAADHIHKLSQESTEPVFMLINSPGGQVLPGMIFVDAMHAAQKRGVRFICVSNVMAASMAFVILSHCDERYARPNTRLLFHPMSISTSGSRIQELVTDLNETVEEEKRIANILRHKMNLSWKEFHPHYFAETFWSAEQLREHTGNNFIRLVDDVQGFEENLYIFNRPGPMFGTAQRVLEKFLSER